jgi:hypothetical protein
MILHLNDGTTRPSRIGAPSMGLALTSVTLDFQDLRDLLEMKDLETYLGILSTRFVPSSFGRAPIKMEGGITDPDVAIEIKQLCREARSKK